MKIDLPRCLYLLNSRKVTPLLLKYYVEIKLCLSR